MSTEFFRKYIDIVDESVRGVMVGPGSTAVRPNSPEERDMVAKGLKLPGRTIKTWPNTRRPRARNKR